VRAGASEGAYGDDVVAGCAELLARWRPEPAPAWVTAVPPARRADLVTPVARRLADALGVPFHAAVRRVAGGPPQREMANANLRHANVRAAFAVADPVPEGPVLLVDDLVDSGWTMTVVGRLLRRAGAAAVHPFALTAAPGRA
jgi:ATP-dependent DNA helicase RecQ